MTTNKSYNDVECLEKQSDRKQRRLYQDDQYFDYSPRGQWLRAAVLGANDGLIAIACLLMSVEGMKDSKPKLLLCLAYVVVGAVGLAVREYISVYSQLDVELAQIKRDNRMLRNQEEQTKRKLPNPLQIAVIAAITFLAGAVTPLVAGSFVMDREVRFVVVVATVSLGLVVFGWIWSVIGGSPVLKSCIRLLFGGLIALGITFGQKAIIG